MPQKRNLEINCIAVSHAIISFIASIPGHGVSEFEAIKHIQNDVRGTLLRRRRRFGVDDDDTNCSPDLRK